MLTSAIEKLTIFVMDIPAARAGTEVHMWTRKRRLSLATTVLDPHLSPPLLCTPAMASSTPRLFEIRIAAPPSFEHPSPLVLMSMDITTDDLIGQIQHKYNWEYKPHVYWVSLARIWWWRQLTPLVVAD